MATATLEWQCACKHYGATLHKKEGSLDYSFFFKRHKETIAYFIKSGHSVEKCSQGEVQ
jgi:hypothetical protein